MARKIVNAVNNLLKLTVICTSKCLDMSTQETRAKPNLQLEKDSRSIKPNISALRHGSGAGRLGKRLPRPLDGNAW
jgi:hypothetical protein